MHNSAQLFRGAVVCGILLLGTAAARAQDNVDCKNAETQMDLDFCAGKDFDAVDAQLNKVYGTLAAKYGAGDKALLKTAEKAWLAYRDAECSYETADTVGGTINPMVETMSVPPHEAGGGKIRRDSAEFWRRTTSKPLPRS